MSTLKKHSGRGKLIHKKLFKHGRSRAVTLPKEFTPENTDNVTIEQCKEGLLIKFDEPNSLDTIEQDPLFATFVEAVYQDAMKHPEKLHDVSEVWGKHDWDSILEGVDIDED